MTNKNYSVLGLMGIGLFLLSGCAVVGSSQVDPSIVYTRYEATYDEEIAKLEYEAEFQVGNEIGTYVELQNGSEVSIDGQVMNSETSIINSLSYVKTVYSPTADELKKAHVFSFKNVGCWAEGCSESIQVYENSFALPGKISVVAKHELRASRASGFEVGWKADGGLQSGESVFAVLSQQIAGGEQSSRGYAQNSSQKLKFSAQDLAGFIAGGAEVQVCRQFSEHDVNAPKAGGYLTGTYCSKSVNVTIE